MASTNDKVLLQAFESNRQQFKSQIFDYYNKYKEELKYLKYDKEYKTECKSKNKIFGYYDIDSKLLQHR